MLGRLRFGAPSRLDSYVAVVVAAGAAALGIAAVQGWRCFAEPSLGLWTLVALALVAEVTLVSSNPALPDLQSRTTSAAFVVAVLAQWGGAAAVLLGAASALVGDAFSRRPARKAAFNAAQYALLYGAMAVVYRALGGTQPFELRTGRLLALTVAVLAGAAVNLLATQLVARIEHAGPSPAPLWRSVLGETQSWALELGIGVAAVLVAQRMPLLTVTLVLPLLPIHAASRAAAEAQRRRAEAEEARAEAEAARGQAEQVAAERARLIEARERLIARLRQLDRQKDELLARVSRELRSPASSILSMVRTLTQDPDRFNRQESLELLLLVMDQAQRLDGLIGQLLLAARLEQPQFDADPATLELADAALLARRAGQLAGLTYPDRPVEVRVADRLPVRVDRRMVSLIVGDLIGNAAKHTPPGTPIWIDLERRGGLAVLGVEDGGPGVPPELRATVFERFTQLDDDERPQGESAGGIGLGLYIARQLARAQGGEVLATDPAHPGGGARFELRFPLADEPDGPQDPPAELPSGSGGRGRVTGSRPTA
jgi:two-component system OmpR family sensor kinase